MRRAALPLLFASAFALLSGCRQTRCEDLVAEPIEGSYRGGGELGEQRLFKVSLEASAQEVVLSFMTRDGSHIRAKYRVLKKSKVR